MTDIFKGIENEVHVGGRVLLNAPEAIVDEIADQWKNRKSEMLTTIGVSAGIGFAGHILLARSPVLATTALTAFGIYQGGKYLMHTGEFMGKAWDADTKLQRDTLVGEGLRGIGKEGAMLVEGGAGFGLGNMAGSVALGKSAVLEGLAYTVTKRAEFPARTLLPEKLSFIGPGTKTLPETLLGKEGVGVDVLKISEMVKQPWSGVEKASSIDLVTGKVSRPMPGTPTETMMGFRDNANRIWVHNHGPLETARPSIFDVGYTQNMGILHHEKTTVFFEGAAKQVVNGRFTGEPIKLRGLALDNETGTAYLFDTVFNRGLGKWEPSVPQYVDWAKARQTLTSLDVKNPFAQFDMIPRVPAAEVPFNLKHLATAAGTAL